MNPNRFKEFVERGKEIFLKIRQKYPDIKAYLVLSNPLGQCNITDSVKEIFDNFKESIIDCDKKIKLSILLEELKVNKKLSKEKIEIIKKQINDISRDIEIKSDVNIELRFDILNYSLINKLRKDDLIDKELTLQTAASIRIVVLNYEKLKKESKVDYLS